MGWIYLGLIFAIIGVPGPPIDAARLADFARLQREIGHTVYVEDQQGVVRTGKLSAAALDGLSLDLGGRQWPMAATEVVAVDREGDSNRDGFIRGALVGLLLSRFFAQGATREADVWKVFVGSAVMYGGIGALIDNGHTGKTRIYRAPPAPSVAVRLKW